MFTVDYAEGYANLPRLLSDDYLVPNEARAGLKKRTIQEDENGLLYLADNLGSVVEFGYIDRKDNNKWWSSREGVFNTESGGIAIIEVVCGCHVQHYDFYFVRLKIKECGQDIRFFRITQFDNNEIYYVPYKPDRRSFVIDKLKRSHFVNSIEDIK